MNSLEFINLEIAITKTKLKEHNKFAQTQLAIRDEKRLKYLQQIKTELEAWEEMKKYIIIKVGHNVYFDSTFEYIELENGCIDESYSEEEGVSIISIKKALEVNDNE